MKSLEEAWQGLEWIVKEDLEKLDFVQWDRYTESGNNLNLYGWIDREDAYKDFVLVTYEALPETNEYRLSAYTSSAKHSLAISEILFKNTNSHADCKRIEDVFDIKNVIKLRGKK